jgi:hypothetical protein
MTQTHHQTIAQGNPDTEVETAEVGSEEEETEVC